MPATMQTAAEDLAQKGGKIKFNVCGDAKRKCVMVNVGMGTINKGSDSYMILDGY